MASVICTLVKRKMTYEESVRRPSMFNLSTHSMRLTIFDAIYYQFLSNWFQQPSQPFRYMIWRAAHITSKSQTYSISIYFR